MAENSGDDSFSPPPLQIRPSIDFIDHNLFDPSLANIPPNGLVVEKHDGRLNDAQELVSNSSGTNDSGENTGLGNNSSGLNNGNTNDNPMDAIHEKNTSTENNWSKRSKIP